MLNGAGRVLVLMLSVLGFGRNCPFSSVSVRGSVSGTTTKNDKIVFELKVTGHDQPDRESIVVSKPEFSTNVRFWTVSHESRNIMKSSQCEAKPELMMITLRRGDEIVDEVTIPSADFLNQFGIIRVKNPVVLKAP